MKSMILSVVVTMLVGVSLAAEDVWPSNFNETYATQLAARSPSGDAVGTSDARPVDARGAGVCDYLVGMFDSFARGFVLLFK